MACVMPANVSQKCVLYMSAAARASVKLAPLGHALDRSLRVDDMTVRACNCRHARITLVPTDMSCQTCPATAISVP